MTRRERAKERVVRAAMLFSKCWDVRWIPSGNRGRLAKLVKACAALRKVKR